MITIKDMKEKHWNKLLKVDDFARQVLIVDEATDPMFKLWMQKLLIRFFEGMGEAAERTIGEWSAELDAFMDHLLEHQPRPNQQDSFKPSSIIKLIPMENNSGYNQ